MIHIAMNAGDASAKRPAGMSVQQGELQSCRESLWRSPVPDGKGAFRGAGLLAVIMTFFSNPTP